MKQVLSMAVATLLVAAGMSFAETPATAPAAAASTQAATAPAEGGLKDARSKMSYTIGLQIGNQVRQTLQQLDMNLDSQALEAGIHDTLAEKAPALTPAELQAAMKAFQQELMAKRQAAEAQEVAEGAKNLDAGNAYLAQNAKKEGVTTLPSGLQYKVLKAGAGKVSPKATDTVTVNYAGTLINGKEFDSSYKRGEPATFPVNGVIAGWTEALQKMHEGDKWQLVIPAKLAYGEQGHPPVIPPNSTLVFEVELLSIGGGK